MWYVFKINWRLKKKQFKKQTDEDHIYFFDDDNIIPEYEHAPIDIPNTPWVQKYKAVRSKIQKCSK